MMRALIFGAALALIGGPGHAQFVSPPAQTIRDFQSFGGRCDGTTDNATAFASATSWLSSASNREVRLPAAICATSATVTLGDGRQQSTTLTALLTGTPTTATVASCAGIIAGDAVGIKRDAGTVFSGTATTCIGTTLTFSPAYSGTDAASGNAVFTGKASSYNGGGFRGYGAGVTQGAVSTIKYTGSAAPTTTLGAQANTTNTSITVASIANIGLGTAVGVTLNDASIWWTWAIQTPTGTTVKIAHEIPSTANNGNTVTIASNPVLRVQGPIFGPTVEGVVLDANNLAAIGLEAVYPIRGSFRGTGGVTAKGYTALGAHVRVGEFLAGVSYGVTDNNFELHTDAPQNQKTIGCWLRGSGNNNQAFSRNRFYGGTCVMGGNDPTAAGMMLDFADNNTFVGMYTQTNGAGLGAGLYRRPTIIQQSAASFPTENTFVAAALVGGIVNGTATGKTTGTDSFPSMSVSDGEPVPTTQAGFTSFGAPFGRSTLKDHFGGFKLTRLSNTQISIGNGLAADSANTAMLYRTTDCNFATSNSGAMGIDAGAVAASTWYSLFVVGDGGGGDAICVAHATTAAAVGVPTLPVAGFAQHTKYAYVGRFKTDGSSNIDGLRLLPRGQFLIDASDTYTPGASGFRPTSVRLLACGGGGSGGSGARQVSGTAASGGVGGSGGGCADLTYPFEGLPTTLSVTVGAGGTATTAPGTDNTAGTVGVAGNPTFFGAGATTAYAYGGAGCAGDGGRLNASAATGGSGAGATNVVGALTLCSNGAAGTAGNAMLGGVAGLNTGATPATINAYGVGNAGGSATISASAIGGFATGRFSCAGGGAGGGVTAGPASINGSSGGRANDSGVSGTAGGTSGTPAGGAGNPSTFAPYFPGNAGAGGFGNGVGGNGGNGGAGSTCSGGGGGGTALNTHTAGNGGKGGDGYAFVWEMR